MAEGRARHPLFSDSTAASLPSSLVPLPTRSSSPLFPASPPEEATSPIIATLEPDTRQELLFARPTMMERRASRTRATREPDSGSLLLSAPTDTASLGSNSSVSYDHIALASPAPSISSPKPSSTLPSHITLPAAPHLVPHTTLAALPVEQLVALVMALSEDRDATRTHLETRDRECEALDTICRDAGVGRGELDRAKVRARVGAAEANADHGTTNQGARKPPIRKEWRIALLPPEQVSEYEAATVLSEVDLDLDDLAEAMGDNAFDVPTPSSTASAEAASAPDNVVSLPGDSSDVTSIDTALSDPTPSTTPIEINPSSSTSKRGSTKSGNRARHASLSSRLFGSFSLASSPASSSPPTTSSLQPPTSSVASGQSKRRHKRSESIKSTSSVASGTSSLASIDGVREEGGAGPKAPYSDWIGWKNWRGPKEKKSTLASSMVEHESPSSSDESETSETQLTPTTVADEADEDTADLTTPMPKSTKADEFFAPHPTENIAEPAAPASPPTESLLSQQISVNRDPSDDPAVASPITSFTSPATSSPSESKRRVPGEPSSPILTRARLPSAPLVSNQQAQGSSVVSTDSRATLSRTSSSRSSRRPSTTLGLGEPGTTVATADDAVAAINSAVQDLQNGDSASTKMTRSFSSSATSMLEPASSIAIEEEEEADPERTIKARRRVSATAAHRKPPTPYLAVMPTTSKEGSSTSATTNAGYVASAKGVFGRALGLGVSTSAPKMIRSHSDGLRRESSSATTVPNLTLFPKLAHLSKYSPFAPAALSTPSTTVSLSAHSSPIVNHALVASTSTVSSAATVPTMMELGVISGEPAPPTLTLHNPSSGQAASEGEEGPMVDRYGFVYDVRSGMKLLREARKRQERAGGGGKEEERGHTDMADEPEDERSPVVTTIEVRPAVEAVQSQAELDAELEMLREALGIPPPSASNSTSPTTVRSPVGPRSPVPNLGPVARPAQLVRTVSSDRPATPSSTALVTSGPQSMKRLLTQLREMSDVQDQKRKLEWDGFIQKRQAKLAKLASLGANGSTALGNGGEDGRDSSIGVGGGRKRAPRAIVVDAGKVNAFSNDVEDDIDASRGRGFGDEQAWRSEDLVGVSQMGVDGKSGKEDWAEFKELVRKGVPIAYRPKIWAECSGANEAHEPGVYQDLLAQHKSEENQCLNQIDMDCHRTFPTNVFFAGSGPGVAKLRNVLVAYSWRNPQIGYCQGMNNLTATLLLTHPAEEDAFWVLVCIIEKILPSDYYTSHLLVSQADQRVLKDLVERLMPDVAAHLNDLGVELPAITFGWFLSLFTDALPIQTLLRVWDLIFVFGTVMLFRVAVAILKLHRTEILSCDSAATLYALMRAMTTHLYQVDKLLKIACEDLKPMIKDRDVSTLRMKHVNELQLELGIYPEENRP